MRYNLRCGLRISPNLSPGKIAIFLGSHNVFYGFIRPPRNVDTIIVTQRMIDEDVKENFLNNKGFPVNRLRDEDMKRDMAR